MKSHLLHSAAPLRGVLSVRADATPKDILDRLAQAFETL